jgi:glycerol-3-phosphate acyltransferase PlsY
LEESRRRRSSVGEYFGSVPVLLASIVAGYLLGALPLADQISRRYGVDIFATGSGLAGASNVRQSVGSVPALLVLVGDLGKGALAVVLAQRLGVEGLWLLLPLAATIIGHWKSIFTNLRGGDGLATLGGGALALFPIIGPVSVAVGMLVQLGGQKMPYTSLMGMVFGYATLVALSLAYEKDIALVLGSGGLAALVLAYALDGHRRRRNSSEWDHVGEEWDDLQQTGGAAE